MKRSHISTGELKYLLLNNLTTDMSELNFFKEIDTSYHYEGYNTFKTEDLQLIS